MWLVVGWFGLEEKMFWWVVDGRRKVGRRVWEELLK